MTLIEYISEQIELRNTERKRRYLRQLFGASFYDTLSEFLSKKKKEK